MSSNNVTSAIIGAAVEVQKRLGPGPLESPDRVCLAYELPKRESKVVEDQTAATTKTEG